MDAKVLDLGAGTGNVTEFLARPPSRRVICAVENNRAMLSILREKCDRLQQLNPQAKVHVVKQNIMSLHGLPRNYFTHAVLNNVLYSLDETTAVLCLRDIRRRLVPGGEIRLSGPKRDTRLDKLFYRIAADLKAAQKFEDLQHHFERVKRINETQLSGDLFKWNVDDIEAFLAKAGFGQAFYRTTKAYAGQAMILAARSIGAVPAAPEPATPPAFAAAGAE